MLLPISLLFMAVTLASSLTAKSPLPNVKHLEVGHAWARNSVNTAVFRKNSVISDKDYQFTAFYDEQGRVVVARRPLKSEQWTTKVTKFSGNVEDAHNSISIALDGDGFLHLAWDHHSNPLRYARSLKPHGLEFTEKREMTGNNETDVTYPEFHSIAKGDLLFLYRDGESGRGNLVINRYRAQQKRWERTLTKLLDGEDERNAYWQAYSEPDSETIHLSWTWRETWDVSTNHDICYAVSHDGGSTWNRSNGTAYMLPITASTAEYAIHIPQGSELINQTSMFADSKGHPYIVSYWTPEDKEVPQYHLVYYDGQSWHSEQISKRKEAFSLSGGGTKKIPISRPQILARNKGKKTSAYLIFRDIERGNRPSIAICQDLRKPNWKIANLSEENLEQWEPSLDPMMWHREKRLALFVQRSAQGDGESLEDSAPQPVSILYWKP